MTQQNDSQPVVPEWKQPGWTPPSYPPLDPDSELGKRLSQNNTAIAKHQAELAALYPKLDDWFRELYKLRIEDTPLQSVFQPRKINPPGGYSAFAQVAGSLYSLCAECAELTGEGQRPAPTQITALTLYYNILRYQVPIYYVSESFLRAVAATDLPADFTLLDLNFPMLGLVMGLPVRFMREYCGRDISYVYAADIGEGVHKPPLAFRVHPMFKALPEIMSPAKVGWSFQTYKDGVMEHFVSSFLKKDRVDVALNGYGYTDYTFADEAKLGEDKDLNHKVNSLMMKLLFVLNMRPGLVETGRMARPAKVKKGRVVYGELWSANVIGAKYRVINNSSQGGTHASPSVHWRRGHTMMVSKGSRKDQSFVSVNALPRREDGEIDWNNTPQEMRDSFWRTHERRWIEPILVNMGE